MNHHALEGDFLETYDGLIFDVKGLLHPKDRIIAYLRYIPASFFHVEYRNTSLKDKKRIKKKIEEEFSIAIADIRYSNELYIKLYDIHSRFAVLSHFKPQYIFHSKLYDFPLQAVPITDIKKIHAPEEHMKSILNLNQKKDLKILVESIGSELNIPFSHIGLSGSSMVELDANQSDYDIIIYGKKESDRVHSYLQKKFAKTNRFSIGSTVITKYRGLKLKSLVKVRTEGFTVNSKKIKEAEKQKTHQFLIDGREVFIRFIELHRSDGNLPNFEDYSFENKGRVFLKGEIIEDRKSYFTPGQYSLKIIENLAKNCEIDSKIIDIFTLRGRFLEQAKNGDVVLIKGKLEQETNLLTQTKSLRIVIGVDKDDFMVPI